MLSNNRGFSLIEVLVTVGLIGVLVGISVPAYNKYKQGTNTMALKADLGNAAKAYGAYDAVNGTFCAGFSQVGFNPNATSPVWNRNAFIGFGSVDNAECPGIPSTNDKIAYTSKGVDPSTLTSKTDCESHAGSWDGSACTLSSTPYEFSGTTLSSSANCQLRQDQFRMGAAAYATGVTFNGGNPAEIHQITHDGNISIETSGDCSS